MVDVLNTETWSPHQALLKAMNDVDDMDFVAIAYVKKNEEKPTIILSTMKVPEIAYLGFAMQTMALE